jgi:hypothetical protein
MEARPHRGRGCPQYGTKFAPFTTKHTVNGETVHTPIASLSLATDLGMGQPMEQGLRTCLVSLALADLVDVRDEGRTEVYYVALLRLLGCTADAHDTALAVGATTSRCAARSRRCWVVGPGSSSPVCCPWSAPVSPQGRARCWWRTW